MKNWKIACILATLSLTLCLPIVVTATEGSQEMVVKNAVVNVYKYANQNSEVVTQALYNEPVKLIQSTAYFVYCQVVDGYKGYIRKTDLTDYLVSITPSGEQVIVKSALVAIYDSAGKEIAKAPMAAKFYGNALEEKYQITLPDGAVGFIDSADVLALALDEAIPQGDGAALVETAQQFLGLNYLWGGCSAIGGIDCSGLTYITAKMNGITLPRDSGPQSQYGEPVLRADAQIGDFIFFSSGKGSKRVNHVAIYIEDGKFIHSAGDSGAVINHFSDKNFEDRYLYMKRMIAKKEETVQTN